MRCQMTAPVLAMDSCYSLYWLFKDQLKLVASSYRRKRYRGILTSSLFPTSVFSWYIIYLCKNCLVLEDWTRDNSSPCVCPHKYLELKWGRPQGTFPVVPPVLCVYQSMGDILGCKGSCFWCLAVCIFWAKCVLKMVNRHFFCSFNFLFQNNF